MTGTLFFVPSADFLDDLPDPPAVAAAPAAKSLGIGDLRKTVTS